MFVPHTDAERDEMLKAVGAKSIEDLFSDVPERFRFPELDLPTRLTEMEIMGELNSIAAGNASTRDMVCFLGAGAYNHYTPAAVDSIIRRGEFLTAYTPYQPEVSQGTLQAIFEYQSLIAALTGMDVSNASHYDGATAAAEAVVLAYHHFRGKRGKVVVSPGVNPHYRETIRTYMQGYDNFVMIGDVNGLDPLCGPECLESMIDTDTSLVLIQYPDFFGRLYDFTAFIQFAHARGALVAVAVNPMALGLLKPPGEFGADIVVGEGQPLGIPLSFGGPYLGIFAIRKEYVRRLAGRLVGETVDKQGRRAYVLTLTAREQHIRREKATSNICTNQGLIALTSTVYMSLLGKQGFRQVSELCYQKAHYAAEMISEIPGFKVCMDRPFFHEFVVCLPETLDVDEVNAYLLESNILGGYNIEKDYPELGKRMLIAVTEMNSKEDIDFLCEILREVSNA